MAIGYKKPFLDISYRLVLSERGFKNIPYQLNKMKSGEFLKLKINHANLKM
jgi:hypothetical protein